MFPDQNWKSSACSGECYDNVPGALNPLMLTGDPGICVGKGQLERACKTRSRGFQSYVIAIPPWEAPFREGRGLINRDICVA